MKERNPQKDHLRLLFEKKVQTLHEKKIKLKKKLVP